MVIERLNPSEVGGEWDEFVATVSGDVLVQSAMWASAKAARFEPVILAARQGSRLVAGCLLMQGSVMGALVSYAPRGPLITAGHEQLAKPLLSALIDVASSLHPWTLIVQPASSCPALDAASVEAGFTPAPLDVTTPATVEVSLDAPPVELMARMRSSRRRNLRKAEKAGVKVRRGGRDDLRTFHRLHANTADRQGFVPMSMRYLEAQADALGSAGAFDVHLAEFEGQTLSAAVTTAFGDRVVFKLAGLSDDPLARDTRASDYLHWQIMLDAQQRGYAFYDLGGFDKKAAAIIAAGGEPPDYIRQSASQFKLGFGGEVKTLPEAVWLLGPGPARHLQHPLTTLAERSSRVRGLLLRLRD